MLHVFLNAHTTWLSLQIQDVSLGDGYECRFPLGHGEPGLPCLWEGADCWVSGTHTLFYFLPPAPPGKKSDEENLFEIITADEVHYYFQAATPKERTEWIKAIQTVSRTGK